MAVQASIIKLLPVKNSEGQAGFVSVKFAILLFMLPFLLASCAPAPESSLRIASNQWIGYEPLYLARDLGYVDAGHFQLLELPNSSAVINAFRNHAIDVAALTLDEALLLQHDGMDVRILLVMDISSGADVLIASPEIGHLANLKGKRVGLESGALGAYMLSRSLAAAGLTPADVVVVPLTADKHIASYVSGSIDALVTFEPMRTELLKKGAKVIFDSSNIPNEIVDVLVVNADVYNSRPQQLRQLVHIWFQALLYIGQNPVDAARLMSPRINLSADEFLASMHNIRWVDLTLNQQLLLGKSAELLTPAQKMADIMLQYRLISKPVNPSLLIDPRHAEMLQ